ncbi:hypothetical protein J2Z40_001253 [Cytobacillus eiseniae]|uniref:Uncharacterized protein n=1 Tax=Cytobacillus eiseniae TaxID=762947 RepID=A0ABS4RDB1_9BACI|nr:hypothetical protein [Cytobacillus eiseniae]
MKELSPIGGSSFVVWEIKKSHVVYHFVNGWVYFLTPEGTLRHSHEYVTFL